MDQMQRALLAAGLVDQDEVERAQRKKAREDAARLEKQSRARRLPQPTLLNGPVKAAQLIDQEIDRLLSGGPIQKGNA